MMEGKKCKLFLLAIVCYLIIIAGLLLFFVGYLFASPLASTMLADFYMVNRPNSPEYGDRNEYENSPNNNYQYPRY